MALNRENIYAALFALLDPLVKKNGGTVLVTTSRRLEFAEEVEPERLPAVFQLQVTESPAQYATSGAACWQFDVDWYIYGVNNDETQPSTPIINPVIDAVLGVLPHEDGDAIVGNIEVDDMICTISLRGPIQMYEGLVNNKNVVEVPLRVLVPTGS